MSTPKPRNHSRAKGKVATSISLSDGALKKAKALAQKENRSLSNYLEWLIHSITNPQAGDQDQSDPNT